ncbi:MAG TPA: hypothetical protein VMU34_04305, partial [Mycobacterium sp.]|nr:hypothetical protein [Mycobacterium sp.]
LRDGGADSHPPHVGTTAADNTVTNDENSSPRPAQRLAGMLAMSAKPSLTLSMPRTIRRFGSSPPFY